MNHLATTTALIVLGGGGYAYLKAGSVGSLSGSIAAASLFLGANYCISKTDHIFAGCGLGVLGGASLMGVSYSRWGKGKTLKIPIMLLVLGAFNFGYYSMKAWEWKESRSSKPIKDD